MTGAVDAGDALRAAPPAELGALLDGRPRNRHLAAALLDLGARGHLALRVVRTGGRWDPGTAWQVELAPRPVWSSAGGLRPHEVGLLDLAAGSADDLGRVVRQAPWDGLLEALRDDAAQRGWLRTRVAHRARPGLLPAVVAQRARTAEELAEAVAGTAAPLTRERLDALLPVAVGLDAAVPWEELEACSVPVPSWFTPRQAPETRGWLGLRQLVDALSYEEPSSWHPKTWDWGALGTLQLP